MRLSVCFTTMLAVSISLFAATPSSGQNITTTKVIFVAKNETLKAALQKLQDNSGFNIFYSSANVDVEQKVTMPSGTRSVAETLDELLKNTGLTYRQEGSSIVISVGKSVITRRITGTVVDETGSPLVGVTVRSKLDRSLSTATDINGRFQIDITHPKDMLIISFIGYVTQEIPAEYRENLKVTLVPDINKLNEVVVIGYGTQKRADLTGSVSTVTAKTIEQQPVANPLAALQGRMAGVQVTQGNGLPGNAVTIVVRSQAAISFGAGTTPLYVVDGVPWTFQNTGTSAGATINNNLNNNTGFSAANGGISPFNSLNPADIESIDVLKDADATAIYGARGGNGVVLITTKKGKAGKTKFDINMASGIGKVGNYIDVLSGPEYLQLRKDAFKNDGVTPTASNAPDLVTWSQTNFTDWQKLLLGGTSHFSNVEGSLSGGNEGTRFLFTPSYHHEGTVFPGSFGENRLSGRLNLDHSSVDKKFYVSFSVNYSADFTNLPQADVSSFWTMAPNYPAFNPNGTLYFLNSSSTNPYTALQQPYNGTTVNFGANTVLRYTVAKGLDAKVTGGYTTIALDQSLQQPATSQNSFSSPVNKAQFATTTAKSYIVEPQLEYKTNLFKGKLDVLLGSTFQQNISVGTTLNGTNYANPLLLKTIGAAGSGNVTASSSYDQYRFNSLFGRVNYIGDDKYLFNGTVRRDGSSRFGPGKRFGTFGAVGLGWVFSRESFIKDNLSFLSFGKLRGSYGITGNDQIPNYLYQSLYNSSSITYQGIAYQSPSIAAGVANPGVQWEANKKLEGGLELGFFHDRILASATYYRNRSSNVLLYASTPSTTGTTSQYENFPATIQQEGYEFELNTVNISSKNFKWNSSFNFTLNNSKLVSFPDLSLASFYSSSYIVGYPLNFTRVYQYTGINPATGVINYQTANASGIPSFLTDQVIAATGTPTYGGLSNSFTFKNFELNFMLQFKHSMGAYNTPNGILGGTTANQPAYVLDYWKNPGDVTAFPAPSATATSAIYRSYSTYSSSDAFYGAINWLKLRNVNISYTVPQAWTKKAHVSNLKIYAQGQNLYTWTKQKNVYDPETGTSYPALRTIVLGLRASF